MNKRMLMCYITILIFTIVSGCNTIGKTDNKRDPVQLPEKNQKTIKLRWEFKERPLPVTQYDGVLTTVYLNLSGSKNLKINLGEYDYSFQVVTPETCTWELPKGSVTQCFGWWAGEGAILGVVREKENQLVVKRKYIWESGGDPAVAAEMAKEKYETIKTIEINSGTRIEIDSESKNNEVFDLPSIKTFILRAENAVSQLDNGKATSKVIGKYDNTDVLEYQGEYSNHKKVQTLLSDYFTDETIELELRKHYLVNIKGKIGRIAASGENFYSIEDRSTFKLILDTDNKKVVEVTVFNDFGNQDKAQYTIMKMANNQWKITDEKGYVYESLL